MNYHICLMFDPIILKVLQSCETQEEANEAIGRYKTHSDALDLQIGILKVENDEEE